MDKRLRRQRIHPLFVLRACNRTMNDNGSKTDTEINDSNTFRNKYREHNKIKLMALTMTTMKMKMTKMMGIIL